MTDGDRPETKSELMSYQEQKRLAHGGTAAQRRALAERDDVRPEILYYLASDPDTEVRRNIARNSCTPHHADLLLAKDEQPEVRVDVATKIADLATTLADCDRSNVYRMTMDALEILARDQLVQVRAILAETLKDSTQAPIGIVQRLARDRELSVAQPVLEFSPLLDDDFLLEIISSEPVHGALSAIARRVALGEDIADAIVHNGDVDAIAALLGNNSAQIREETLYRIVDQASGEPTWHKPLVHRPNLHSEAARRIAEIVATPLLADLRERTDLDAHAISVIKEIVLTRLEGGDVVGAAEHAAESSQAASGADDDAARPAAADKAAPAGAGKVSAVSARVRQMYLDGQLNEQELSGALASGGREFVIESIAVLSKTPLDVVTRAMTMRSTKAIAALCWKAGLSMRLATRVQMHLAHIPPSNVLRPTVADGYPLSEDEMRWQLEFISGLSATA